MLTKALATLAAFLSLAGCAAVPRAPFERQTGPCLTVSVVDVPRTLTSGVDSVVWLEIRNGGALPIAASFSDALIYSVQYEDGSGHSSDRVRGGRRCAEKHWIPSQQALRLPRTVHPRKTGMAVVTFFVEPRALSESGACLDEIAIEPTTFGVQVQ